MNICEFLQVRKYLCTDHEVFSGSISLIYFGPSQSLRRINRKSLCFLFFQQPSATSAWD